MKLRVEEIGARMDALGMWDALAACNWAVKPRGTAFPYFCTVFKGGNANVKVRFLMLEGWQTFHDYMRVRLDGNFGFYQTPMEMPHFELVILVTGACAVFRHDPGYMPREVTVIERELTAKILWECYGIMMRIESDSKLPLKFADRQSLFARCETADGRWEDTPLPVPRPRAYTENVALRTDDLKVAKDLPFEKDEALELDFRMVQGLMTKERRPRCCYRLLAIAADGGEKAIDARISIDPESGLKGMWEALPQQVLKAFLRRGKVAGEIRLVSGRVFRLLRALGIELPFKLSLHDSLPSLEKAFAESK